MLSRRFTSASVLVLALLAAAAATGCAKRYEGSIKDDPAPSEATDKPARKYTPTVHKARAEQPVPPREPIAKAPQDPTPRTTMLPAVKAPPPLAPSAKVPDEPCASSEKCASQLRTMLNDQTRSWIGKPQTLDEHFTGTRQFAYLALSKVLKCPELAAGIKDIQATATMSATPGKYPLQRVAQIKELNTHVENELTRETRTRCPK